MKTFNYIKFFLIAFLFFQSCDLRLRRIYDPKPNENNTKKLENKNTTRQKLQILVIGDWGEKGNFFQKDVASAMEKIMRQRNIDIILTTGDNFYPSGAESLEDSHFKKSFEEIYPFAQNIPWYVSLGNHDYYGNIQAQIDYEKINSNWNLPSSYYSIDTDISTNRKATVAMVDTNEFIQVAGISYRSYMNKNTNEIQLNWMDKTFKANETNWKIAVGHHPVFSAGQHGDTEELKSNFLDTLEKNKVDIYFAGHEHDLQYLKHPKYKTHFLISGAGSKVRKIKSSPYSIFAASEAGFILATLEDSQLLIEFINTKTEVIYSTIILK